MGTTSAASSLLGVQVETAPTAQVVTVPVFNHPSPPPPAPELPPSPEEGGGDGSGVVVIIGAAAGLAVLLLSPGAILLRRRLLKTRRMKKTAPGTPIGGRPPVLQGIMSLPAQADPELTGSSTERAASTADVRGSSSAASSGHSL